MFVIEGKQISSGSIKTKVIEKLSTPVKVNSQVKAIRHTQLWDLI